MRVTFPINAVGFPAVEGFGNLAMNRPFQDCSIFVEPIQLVGGGGAARFARFGVNAPRFMNPPHRLQIVNELQDDGDAYRRVHLALTEAQQKRILKTIHFEEAHAHRYHVVGFFREINALRVLRGHPIVPEIYGWQYPAQHHAYVEMEYVDGPSLHNLLQSHWQKSGREAPLVAAMPPVLRTLADVAEFLYEAHEELVDAAGTKLKFVHRDIKPDNIMVAVINDLTQTKLIDYDTVSTDFDNPSLPKGSGGTPHYMPREAFFHESPIHHSRDLYSLGIVLLQALGFHHFEIGQFAGRTDFMWKSNLIRNLGWADKEDRLEIFLNGVFDKLIQKYPDTEPFFTAHRTDILDLLMHMVRLDPAKRADGKWVAQKMRTLADSIYAGGSGIANTWQDFAPFHAAHLTARQAKFSIRGNAFIPKSDSNAVYVGWE